MVLLESSRLFSGLPPGELDRLKQSARIQSYQPNEVIFKEGDQGDGMYLIQKGSVQISSLINNTERRTLSNLPAGEFFGEMAIIDNAPRSATASAREETTVCFLPSTEVQRLLEQSPRLAIGFTREFSARIREFNRRYIEETLQAERLSLVGRFARSIVHDFKNPLNVIGIASELAGMPHASPEARKMAAGRIRKQVDRLGNMINELLEFTRGSQNSAVLAPTRFDHFVLHLMEDLQAEVKDRGTTIERANEPPPAVVLIDPNRLTHVFYNLAHNAVDAMQGGGQIFFRFEVKDRELLTEIRDTGSGIAPEIIPRLFEAFATFGKVQGSGLGLSICKKIVEDHKGSIWAKNAPEGGAMFTFSLPLAPAAAGV